MNIYPELKAACLPTMESYHDDLLVIDRKIIEAHPEEPFVHYTRAWGTELIPLTPWGDARWPKEGELAPYIFGHSTRWHILAQASVISDYMARTYPTALVHHFDGTSLGVIDHERAGKIVREWQEQVRAIWTMASKCARQPQLQS